MKAVVLSAKKKESLFPLSDSKPTGLMPIGGEKPVTRIVRQLEDIGVNEILVVVNHLEQEFKREFDSWENVKLLKQEELKGTAEALKQAESLKDSFLVVNGDIVTGQQDLKKLKESHENNNASGTVLATEDTKPEKFGVLEIQDDRVREIKEKPDEPETPLINTGIYGLEPSIFDYIERLEDDETSIVEALNNMINEEMVKFELVETEWIDIGSFRKIRKADKWMRQRHEGFISENAEIHENTHISENSIVRENAVIKPGSVIEENSYIGKNTVIGPNTTVRDSTVNNESSVDNSVVDRSILYEKNIVDPNVYIENSITGEETDIKSGTVIRESFIGSGSFIEINNSILGTRFVPEARTDLSEISK